jgi:LuxR family maltose regulon positive regulatory protein
VRWKQIALAITFWLTEALQREGALLIGRLLHAKQQVIEAGDRLITVGVMEWLAITYWRAGRLRLVEQECLEALALVGQFGQHNAREGYLHVSLARTYYASNRLEAADLSVQHLLRIAQTWQQADLLIVGELFLAQLSLAEGDLAATEPALQKAEELVEQERFVIHSSWLVALRVRYWLAAGDLDVASNWAEHVVFSPETWDPNRGAEFLMRIRVYLAQQQYKQALAALERFSIQLDRPGDIQTTIAFLALHAVALHFAGKGEHVRAVAARLLALTEPEDNVRVYLDLAEPMKQVLQSLLVPLRDQKSSLAVLGRPSPGLRRKD